MNYSAHYNRLIGRARHRTITGYKERHHILPRCMGGMDVPDNLVDLTPEEHFVAHQLLVRMYPKNASLVHAALLMAKRATGNKAFGWLRRRKAQAMLGHKMLPKTRESLAAANRGNKYVLGKKHSPETRAKMVVAQRGKPKSFNHREKLSISHIGKKLSSEHRAKVSASLIGNKRTLGYKASPETRAKMSATRRGKLRGQMSAETRLKISIAKIGKIRSAESRAKQSLSTRGKPKSPEHREKLAAHLRALAMRRKANQITSVAWPRR